MSLPALCFAFMVFGKLPFLNTLLLSQLHGVLTGSDLSCFQSAIFFHAFTIMLFVIIMQCYIFGTCFDLSVGLLRSAVGSMRCRLFLARLCGRSRFGYKVYANFAGIRAESIRRQAEELIRVNAEDAELNAAYLENAAFRA